MTEAPVKINAPETAAPRPGKDCWNRIGVWGDGGCAALARHVHCRHCPVYAAAAAQLLEGPPPAGYLDEWSAHFAAAQADTAPATVALVLFRINSEWLALPVETLAEVVERRPVHVVPHTRCGALKGLVNIRGQLLLCVSLTKLLGLPFRSADEKTRHTSFERMLVVARAGERLVFPVSEVFGLHRCRPDELLPPPATVARAGAHFTRAVLAWRHRRRDQRDAAEADLRVARLDEQTLFQTVNRSLA